MMGGSLPLILHRLHRCAEQMLDLQPKSGVELIGETLPVAIGRVAFVAQQTQRPTRSRQRGLGERGQLIKFVLRLRRLQVALENAQHLVSMTAARCQAPLFRGAELLQMHVADAALIEPSRELAFRKSRPPRCRNRPHINQEPCTSLRQRIEKGVCG